MERGSAGSIFHFVVLSVMARVGGALGRDSKVSPIDVDFRNKTAVKLGRPI